MDAVLKPVSNGIHVNPQRGPRVASSTGARNLERGRGSLSLYNTANEVEVGGERRAAEGVSFVVEFPGGPSCPPPRPPRLYGAAAEAAAERNVGTMTNVLNADANRDYQSPRPQQKLRSTEAKDNAARYSGTSTAFCLNYDRNRGYSSARGPCIRSDVGREALERGRGVMAKVLAVDDNLGYETARPASRLMGAEAELNAQRDRGCAVRQTLDVDGNKGYQTARPASRAVTVEARENAARCNSLAIARVMGSDDVDVETTPRLEPRVTPQGRDAAMKNRGKCGLALEGRLASDPVNKVRVTGSGKDNYERGRQGSMNGLLSDSGQVSVTEQRPMSRVRDAGTEISQSAQSGTVHQLFNSYGEMPRSARPAARVRPEARQNAIRNMGTMSDFL